MYFLNTEVAVVTDSLPADVMASAKQLLPDLLHDRSQYLHFGPYWWWVKILLRTIPAGKGTWIRRSYHDTTLVHESDPMKLAQLGFAYREISLPQSPPRKLHIIEGPESEARWYKLADPDAVHQLDLFSESTEELPLPLDAADFSVSPWLRRADELIAADRPHEAIAALTRAVERTHTSEERNGVLLQMAQVFRDHGHHRKALLCYRDAIERGQEPWIYGLMGDVYLEQDQPSEAARCYKAALAAMPGNPEYRFGYERALSEVKRHTDSRGEYSLQDDQPQRVTG